MEENPLELFCLAVSQFERIFKIDRLLRGKTRPDMRKLLRELEVSEATIKRDLEYMRSRLNAPLTYDRPNRAYCYESAEAPYQIPGVWFTADEIGALLLILRVIDEIEPSFLRDQIRPFEDRLRNMSGISLAGTDAISQRVVVLTGIARIIRPACLDTLVQATIARCQLAITYFSRGRAAQSARVISPVRLVYYRSGWYLDAWCHQALALRRFAADAILTARTLPQTARDMELTPVGEGYGIFCGPPVLVAQLKFNAHAAMWMRTTVWHKEQRAEEAADGGMILEIPYSEPAELLMDILRHGADVEVLSPPSLRKMVAETLANAAQQYSPQTRKLPVTRERQPTVRRDLQRA
jgi:predicted DNA-binding transcriptional regulator YafY